MVDAESREEQEPSPSEELVPEACHRCGTFAPLLPHGEFRLCEACVHRLSKAPPRIWPVFAGFALAIVGAMAAAFIGIEVVVINQVATGAIPSETVSDWGISFVFSAAGHALKNTSYTASFLLVALIGARRSGEPWQDRLRIGSGRVSLRQFLAILFGLLWLGQVYFSTFGLIGVGAPVDDRTNFRIITGSAPDWFLLTLILNSTAASAEQFFLLGFMQTRLRQRWHPVAAIVVVAACSTLLKAGPVDGAYYFLCTIFLGWCAELGGTVWHCVLVRAINSVAADIMARSGVNFYGADNLVAPLLGVVFTGTMVWYLYTSYGARSSRAPAV